MLTYKKLEKSIKLCCSIDKHAFPHWQVNYLNIYQVRNKEYGLDGK